MNFKVDPPKRPLITPSATPPLSRPSNTRKLTAKTARVAYTPTPSVLSTVSDQVDPEIQLHHARRASSLRVLDIWSQLADRYSRSLDSDDIVDLGTEEIIKDRGILRGAPGKYSIGCFADAVDDSSEGAPDVDDDFDELDSFAPEANISDELENERKKRAVPPVKVMDPADAQDLKEFLEAEKRRKEEFGDVDADLDEDESDEVLDSRECDDDEGTDGEGTHEEDIASDVDDEHSQEEWDSTPPPLLHVAQSTDDASLPPEDDESEDELGAWDLDEGNTVYLVPHGSDDKIDIIEPPPTSPSPLSSPQRPSPSRASLTPYSTPRTKQPGSGKGKVKGLPRQPVFTHLQTPPRSQSSTADSYTSAVFLSRAGVTPTSPQATPISQPASHSRPRPTPAYKGEKGQRTTPLSPTKSKAISVFDDDEPPITPLNSTAKPNPLRTSTPARSIKKKEVHSPLAAPERPSLKRLPAPHEESDVPETPEPEDQGRKSGSPKEEPECIELSDSDDPISLPPSPTKGKGKAKQTLKVKDKGNGNGKMQERGILATLGVDTNAKARKRKRIASGNDSWETSLDGSPPEGHDGGSREHQSLDAGSTPSRVSGRRGRPPQKVVKSVSRLSNESSDVDDRNYPYPESQHRPPGSSRTCQPSPQQPYPAMPIPLPGDPNVQMYLAQAMQQFAAYLMNPTASPQAQVTGAGWTLPLPPFPPTPSSTRSSRPPDSSPSLRHASSRQGSGQSPSRPSSLVERSMSRGRRVSFKLEAEVVGTSYTDDVAIEDHWKGESSSAKSLQLEQPDSESDDPLDDTVADVVTPVRGRGYGRAQTPGPPAQTQSEKSGRQRSVSRR